ncbi:MAG TPA: hypothetical protein VEW95_09210 [Candidatus Limnocylindrales bacterium]|nr:hypothetical protein [Candidatus Limnocylindrales bacterium]
MSSFSFVCTHARPDENGAHDIDDAMSADPPVLFCRRCGEAVNLADALEQTGRNPDGPGDKR